MSTDANAATRQHSNSEHFWPYFKAGMLCGACMLAAVQYAASELSKTPPVPPSNLPPLPTASGATPGSRLDGPSKVPRSPDIKEPL